MEPKLFTDHGTVTPEGRDGIKKPHRNFRIDGQPTSKEAGMNMEKSGCSSKQRLLCYNYVVDNPGLTAREIEASCGSTEISGRSVSKRLPELRRIGWLENRKTKTCTISGRKAITWWAVVTELQN